MKDWPLRNIFLPATIVGVGIFSSLAYSLPTVMNTFVEPTRSDLTGTESRSPIELTGLHKEVAISYIGGAMVLSACAGMGAAELLRRLSQKPTKSPDFKAALAEFMTTQEPADMPATEAKFTALLADFSLADAAAEAGHDTPVSDRYQFPQDFPEAAWNGYTSDSESVSAQPQKDNDTVTIFPGQYERCRIQLPNSQQHQYAIAFKNQFYSLINSGVSKEEALTAVRQLALEERAAILTRMNQGFAIWVLEPSARLISATSPELSRA